MISKLLHRIYGIIAIGGLLSSFILSGCNDDAAEGLLEFSDDNLLLKAAGDTLIVDVNASSAWKAESMASWCTVEKGQGEASGKLVVRVAPTDDIYERGTSVKVTCGDNIVRLAIRQQPMEFEVLESKKTLNFEKRVGNDTLKINTNMSWKVEIADTTGWLQVADTVGSGSVNLVFTTTDNSQNKERATTIRLRYGIRSLKLTASQKGGIRVDGHIQKHYGERDLANGFNLIFLGDGFVAEDLISETGVFDKAVEEACHALFSVEPYKTHKEYFNVYSIACESKERGAGTPDNPQKTVFSCTIDDAGNIEGTLTRSSPFAYANKILGMNDQILQTNTVLVVLINDERYGGTTYWYSDGRALSFVPLNRDTQLPGGFTNLFLHEAGGHGIGKLADEWSTDKPLIPATKTMINKRKQQLYYSNLGLPPSQAMMNYPSFMWSYSSAKPEYANVVKGLDGGFGYVSNPEANCFIAHCEENSCMLNHLPYYNLASRYSIMQYVLFKLNVFSYDYAGMQELTKYFVEHDKFEVPASQTVSDRPMLPPPIWLEIIN